MKDISFIIPVYNTRVDKLSNCIKSIESQQLTDFEIIIVNDGSTSKNTLNFLNLLKRNPQIKILNQTNLGSAEARNRGIEASSKRYICFVDSDDELKIDFFTQLKGISNLDKYDYICFDYLIKYNSSDEVKVTLGTVLNLSLFKDDLIQNILYKPHCFNDFMFGSIWGKIFSKEFLIRNSIKFDSDLRKTQDRVFMLRCSLVSRKLMYFPIESYIYVINLDSITHKYNLEMVHYCKLLLGKVEKICQENKVSNNYFVYAIFFEMLQLTYFHKMHPENLWKIDREHISNLYKEFSLDKKIRQISINDFKSLKGKIKFLLLRYKFFYILRLYFKK